MCYKKMLFVVRFDEEAENLSERTETGSLLQFKILTIKKQFHFIQQIGAFWVTDAKISWNVVSTESSGETISLNKVADC